MAKNKLEEHIEELDKWRTEQEIENGIRKGLNKWMHTICITATSAIFTGVYTLGGFVYSNYERFEVAIKAFLAAGRNGQ
jgi:hypothetical protein